MVLVLKYFPLAGRGAIIRAALKLGKVDFVDEVIQFSDFPAIKPTLPLGQLPVMTLDDGTTLCQTNAILAYAAQVGGLIPKDALQNAAAYQIIHSLEDLQNAAIAVFKTKDEEAKKEGMKNLADVEVPKILGAVCKFIEKYGSKGFAVGQSFTFADAYIHGMALNFTGENRLPTFPEKVLEQYPAIQKVFEKVEAAISGDANTTA